MAANSLFLHPRRDSGDYGINVRVLPTDGTLVVDFISDGVAVSLFFKNYDDLIKHLGRLGNLAISASEPDLAGIVTSVQVELGSPERSGDPDYSRDHVGE